VPKCGSTYFSALGETGADSLRQRGNLYFIVRGFTARRAEKPRTNNRKVPCPPQASSESSAGTRAN
jgi:hypothetical protein